MPTKSLQIKFWTIFSFAILFACGYIAISIIGVIGRVPIDIFMIVFPAYGIMLMIIVRYLFNGFLNEKNSPDEINPTISIV